jgi:hypothetical protein
LLAFLRCGSSLDELAPSSSVGHANRDGAIRPILTHHDFVGRGLYDS